MVRARRRLDVTPATVHKRLEELRANGIPLESEKDHPHVYWSVPKSWYPGGVLFTGEQVRPIAAARECGTLRCIACLGPPARFVATCHRSGELK